MASYSRFQPLYDMSLFALSSEDAARIAAARAEAERARVEAAPKPKQKTPPRKGAR